MTRLISALFALLAVAATCLGQSPGWLQWAATDDLYQPDAFRDIESSAGPDGSVYVMLTDGPCRVQRYSSTGTLLWSKDFGADCPRHSYGPQEPVFPHIAATSTGVFVAVRQQREYPSGENIALLRYDSAGNLKWMKWFPGTSKLDVSLGVKADASGNAVLYAGSGLVNKFYKFDPGGKQLWFLDYPNELEFQDFSLCSNGQTLLYDGRLRVIRSDGAVSCTLSSPQAGFPLTDGVQSPVDGSVFYASSHLDQSMSLHEADSTGNEKWSLAFNGRTTPIACDPSGNVYVEISNLTLGTNTLNKISPSGLQLWSVPLAVGITRSATYFDANQNLYAAELGTGNWPQYSGPFAKITPSGVITQIPYNTAGAIQALGPLGIYLISIDQTPPVQVFLHHETLNGIADWTAGPFSGSPQRPWVKTGTLVDLETEHGITDGVGTSYEFRDNRLDLYGSDGQFQKRIPYPNLVDAILPLPGGGAVYGGTGGMVCIDTGGKQLWQYTVPPYTGATPFHAAKTGEVYFLGGGPGKVSNTGQLLWQFPQSENIADQAAANDTSGVSVLSYDSGYTLRRFDPNGNVLYAVTVPLVGAGPKEITTLQNDALGNTYLLGNYPAANGDLAWYLRKYGPAGSLSWTYFSDPNVPTTFADFQVAANGAVDIIGSVIVSGAPSPRIWQISSAGGLNFLADTRSFPQVCWGQFCKLDSKGRLVAVFGSFHTDTSFDYFVVRMDSSGGFDRTWNFDAGFGEQEVPTSLWLDNSDNVYVHGSAAGPPGTMQLGVQKYKDGPIDYASFTGQAIPTKMETGASYAISVTFKNSGTTTWTPSGGYRLDCLEPGTWGVSTLALASADSIATGASKTFAASIAAPTTPGTYTMAFQMEHSGAKFGDMSLPLTVKVLQQTNFAQFVSQTVPASMICGQSYAVKVQYQNTGTTAWTSGAGITLESMSPTDNTIWGSNRIPLAGGSVAPGAVGTFSRTVIAPTVAGTYSFGWQPLQEGGLNFSTPTPVINVTVSKAADAAQFVGQSGVPATIDAGADFTSSIVFKNVGTNMWVLSKYALISRAPYNNQNWGTNSVALPAMTSPGANATFTRVFTSPLVAGNYAFEWSMMNTSTGALFGDLPVAVNVVVTIGPNDAKFAGQAGIPLSIGPGGSFTGTINFTNLGTAGWGSTYSMVSRAPYLNTNWGVATVAVSGTVAPGATASFTHTFTAPTTPGTYNFKWRMSAGGVPFGQESTGLSIVVSADAAQYVSTSSQPTTIAAGKDFYVQYTMKNAGTTNWTGAGGYSLLSASPSGNMTWGRSTIGLSSTAPGANVLITGLCTSPVSPGTYAMQWQMSRNGVPFGEKTPLINVVVSLGPDDALVVSQAGIPSTVIHGAVFTPTITMKNLGTATWSGPTYALSSVGSNNFGVASISSASVAQNANGIFVTTFKAPATPGTYIFQMRMTDGTTKFGQATTPVAIIVT